MGFKFLGSGVLRSVKSSIKGVTCIWDVDCARQGFAQYLARIRCPKLSASVKMAFLVARIGAQKEPCVHLFQK